ncbi:hypothetical protein MUK42_00214 [Musa troglodytarum]|uniref:Uncharacterized protein n=1 Tax=Musa troglodytarum TaxID=320322 RepID=A0A9E7FHM3_9LILI|nr:hypothetical protein MUK42_00214 [Musa troglodytarum]
MQVDHLQSQHLQVPWMIKLNTFDSLNIEATATLLTTGISSEQEMRWRERHQYLLKGIEDVLHLPQLFDSTKAVTPIVNKREN